MSITEKGRNGWVIIASFVFAMILSVFALPLHIQMFMPEWTLLVLIYWCMALPLRVGVGTAWIVGLFMDVLRDTLLGQYALAFALIAFLTLHLHQRIRVVPVWQQSISIFILTLISAVLVFWVKGIQGVAPDFISILSSPLISALIWPAVFLLMRNLRRVYQVK
ncbi:MAG: rod shape-determining protein MreD [Gammaproteobacteria bacterium]|nr:rod shape-determining protein MreD [Gammaproteobacteria bacterium]